MKVAVIIPLYRVFKVLPLLVNCNLLYQTYKDIELYIGDDCSDNLEEGIEIAKQFVGVSNFTFFSLTERIPWSIGDIINHATYMTDAELLVLSMADIIFKNDYIEKHALIQSKRGPIVLEGITQYITAQEEVELINDSSKINSVKLIGYNRRPHDYTDEYCCNEINCNKCNIFCHAASVNKYFYDKIGGIRPEYSGHYSPFDIDLFKRLEQISVYGRRSFLPVSVQIWEPCRHGAPYPGENNRDPVGYPIFDNFFKNIKNNYINTHKSNRNLRMIIDHGKLC
jgi:hypothetical protein